MRLRRNKPFVAQGEGGTGGLKIILSRVGQLTFLDREEEPRSFSDVKHGLEGPRPSDPLLKDFKAHTPVCTRLPQAQLWSV